MDTSGFYKNESDLLLYAPNCVINIEYELHREFKDTYTYPVDGWTWFDNEDDAYATYNLEKPIV